VANELIPGAIEPEAEETIEPAAEGISPDTRQHISDEVSRIKSGQQRLAKTTPTKKDEFVDKMRQDAKGQVKQGVRQAAGKAAQQAAKAATRAAMAAARAVGALISSGPVGWIILAILIIIILVFILIAIPSFSGIFGGGPGSYPTTQVQKEQATLLAALAGDRISKNEVVLEVVKDEKERYGRIESNATKYDPSLSASITAKKVEFSKLLDSMMAETNLDRKKAAVKDIQAKMILFENTLPFGRWIFSIASASVDQPSGNFCRVTKVAGTLACASFVSTVLSDAGVPNSIVATTEAVWEIAGLRTVVNRPDTKSDSLFDKSKGALRPGDIIWWGDGNCSSVKRATKIFDHVGFYIGDGMSIDNSSELEKVAKRHVTGRDCWAFNGAKRYGSD